MADDPAKKQEKLKHDVEEKVNQLKNAAERIKLPDNIKKDLIMVLKRLLCRLTIKTLEPEDIISDICLLEEAIKQNKEDEIQKATTNLVERFNRSSSCCILGDHCVRSSREERKSDVSKINQFIEVLAEENVPEAAKADISIKAEQITDNLKSTKMTQDAVQEIIQLINQATRLSQSAPTARMKKAAKELQKTANSVCGTGSSKDRKTKSK
ncbi:unnamed protein product [Nezara viridula]|uniref:Uncharacterized protein n=1 Tax=Nezara viridula TaxID=85310 RepID=A0A9P0MUQ6_NEZVI|nr:unnamed protein product [Nezara viridula]